MTKYNETYFKKIGLLLEEILEHESNKMEETAKLFYECIRQNGRIFVSGSGHSSIVAQESFSRQGGHDSIKPILIK